MCVIIRTSRMTCVKTSSLYQNNIQNSVQQYTKNTRIVYENITSLFGPVQWLEWKSRDGGNIHSNFGPQSVVVGSLAL